MEEGQPLSLGKKLFISFCIGWLLFFFLSLNTSAALFPNDAKSINGIHSASGGGTVATVPSGHTWTLLETCISTAYTGAFYMQTGSEYLVYIYHNIEAVSSKQVCSHPYKVLSAGSTITVTHPSTWTTGYNITYVDYDLSIVNDYETIEESLDDVSLNTNLTLGWIYITLVFVGVYFFFKVIYHIWRSFID